MLETRRAGEVVARDVLRPRGDGGADRRGGVEPRPKASSIGASAPASPPTGSLQIECTLRDERGDVACGERVVTAEVDGGELLGLENGDLRDNTPYTAHRRRTLDGRLIVFVQPGAIDDRDAELARACRTCDWSASS